MIARLRSAWASINASYWFYPALFTLAAMVLATVSIWLDRHGAVEWLAHTEWLTPSRPQGARSLLSLIAGSMIGVAATVFSITIAAVAYASGTYGPRLLTNFLEDRGNQLSLATFIATFVYSLLVLRVIRGEDEQAVAASYAATTMAPGFVPQLSLLIAFGLTLMSVAVLVYLLNHIPSSIRINKVIERIGRRLLTDIGKRFPDEGDVEPVAAKLHGTPILSHRAGYISITEFESLDELAKDNGGRVVLARRTGDFVHAAVPLLYWQGSGDIDDDLASDLRACFAIASSRSAEQDLDYLIDELVEIALRALSPGINDPFTAISALNWLGAATAELAGRKLDCGPEQSEYDIARVHPLADGFDHYLQRGFGSAIVTVATSDVAAANFFEIVADMIPAAANSDRRDAMLEILDAMLDHARCALDASAFARLETQRRVFGKALPALLSRICHSEEAIFESENAASL